MIAPRSPSDGIPLSDIPSRSVSASARRVCRAVHKTWRKRGNREGGRPWWVPGWVSEWVSGWARRVPATVTTWRSAVQDDAVGRRPSVYKGRRGPGLISGPSLPSLSFPRRVRNLAHIQTARLRRVIRLLGLRSLGRSLRSTLSAEMSQEMSASCLRMGMELSERSGGTSEWDGASTPTRRQASS
jgi:hypothetical protein